jgi:hypothetical protein
MPASQKIKYSSQEIDNMSFDETYGLPIVQQFNTPKAIKITEAGSVTYIADAPVGSSQASAVWRAQKLDETSGLVITWADSGNYSQIATDLTALSYS